MRHGIVLGLVAVFLLGNTTHALANDFHLVLNGFSQEVHTVDEYKGILGTSARSVSWWYRSHVSSFPTVWGLIFWGEGNGPRGWTVQLQQSESGSVNLSAEASIAWSAERNPAIASLQDGQWHHLVMTAPESGTMENVRLYLDGALVPVVSVLGGSLTNSYDTVLSHAFRVGTRFLGNHSDADIDEFALWDVELTAAAVAEIFNGGIPTDLRQDGSSYTSAADLQLYWTFEEGTGLTTTDLSGNGHAGILIAGDSVDSWGTNPPGSGSDSDGDGILDGFDNCPGDSNAGQENQDGDALGDLCDPFPDDPNNDLVQCSVDLGSCQTIELQCQADLQQAEDERGEALADLAAAVADADADTKPDLGDACPGTAAGEDVDNAGCSLVQFCASFDASQREGSRQCKKADWKNDEPLMRRLDRDCTVERGGRGPEDDICVPTLPAAGP